eukprot:1596871-Prymnesium_polylepis.1
MVRRVAVAGATRALRCRGWHTRARRANSQCIMGTRMTIATTPLPAYGEKASPCTQVDHHCPTQPSPTTWN